MKRLRNRFGQGTIEWVMLAAIVVGLIVVLWGRIKGPANDKINEIQTGLTNTGQNN